VFNITEKIILATIDQPVLKAKPRSKREKSTTTHGHYVTNSMLLPAIRAAKEKGIVTNELIKMINMIAERYSRKSNWVGYSFREDMVSVATANLFVNALKFDQERYSNAFAYYTQAIHNSFLQYLADEKKHRNIRDALLIDAGSNPSFNFLEVEKDESHFEQLDSDSITNDTGVRTISEAMTDVPNTIIDGKPEYVPPPIAKVRHPGRMPGPVKTYAPEDYTVDEKGNITIKEGV
jgi:hypothetical protein